MSFLNYGTGEMNIRIIYLASSDSEELLSQNLNYVYERTNPDSRSPRITSFSDPAGTIRFFEFIPMGKNPLNRAIRVRVDALAYTNQDVPMTFLQGADAIICLVDAAGLESVFPSLDTVTFVTDKKEVPIVVQLDAKEPPESDVASLKSRFGYEDVGITHSVISKGEGVMNTLKQVYNLVVNNLSQNTPGA